MRCEHGRGDRARGLRQSVGCKPRQEPRLQRHLGGRRAEIDRLQRLAGLPGGGARVAPGPQLRLVQSEAVGVAERLLVLRGRRRRVRRDLHREAFASKRVGEGLGALRPELLEDLRIQQHVRTLAEEVADGAAARLRVGLGAHEGKAAVARGDCAFVEQLVDPPLGKAVPAEGDLRQLGLGLLVGQAGEQLRLPQVQAALAKRRNRLGRQGRKRGEAAHVDVRIAERRGDHRRCQLRLQHLADGDDHVGDMHRHGGVGEEDGGGLAGRVGLFEDLHGIVAVDVAGRQQDL